MYNNPFDNSGYQFDDLELPHQYFARRTDGQMPPSGGRPNQPGPMRPPTGGSPNRPGGQPSFPGVGSNPSPMGPPPSFTPATPMAQAHGGGMHMNRCLFRNTYVWMRNGRGFWFFPTTVTRNMIFGFRWSNRNGWLPRTIQRDHIMTFTCSFF